MDTSEFINAYYRAATDDIRFTLPMLWAALSAEPLPSARQRVGLSAQLVAAGAKHIGQARVGLANTQKDCVYAVALGAWPEFLAYLAANPLAAAPSAKPQAQTTAQRLAKLEAQMVVVLDALTHNAPAG